jgi:type III secretory pathway component EscU
VSDDERSPGVMVIEAHEELMQRIESGQTRIRTLAIITIVVCFFLVASYFSQILLPFVEAGQRYQVVDLLDPTLIAVEVVVLLLACAWLYVGIMNYLFAARLGRQIKEIRAAEREIERKITGT